MALSETERKQILALAAKKSQSAKLALLQEEARRDAMKNDLTSLLQLIKSVREEKDYKLSDVKVSELQESVIKDIEANIKEFDRFNEKIASLTSGVDIAWGLKTNKMGSATNQQASVLGGAITHVKSENLFNNILDNKLTDGILERLQSPTMIGDYNSLTTHTSAALLHTLFVVKEFGEQKSTNTLNPNLKIYDICQQNKSKEFIGSSADKWLHTSSIVYPFTLPDTLSKEYDFGNFRYAYTENGIANVGVVHSGFSFGGESLIPRDIENMAQKNPFAPNDSSAFITKIGNCAERISTQHQFCHAKFKLTQDSTYLPDWWKNKDFSKDINASYDVLKTTDVKELSPGDIYCFRRFTSDTKVPWGNSGHTAMFLGLSPDQTEVVSIEYNRDMPKMDGFGIRVEGIDSFKHGDDKQFVCFSIKEDEKFLTQQFNNYKKKDSQTLKDLYFLDNKEKQPTKLESVQKHTLKHDKQ